MHIHISVVNTPPVCPFVVPSPHRKLHNRKKNKLNEYVERAGSPLLFYVGKDTTH